jgi:hypothetical protein
MILENNMNKPEINKILMIMKFSFVIICANLLTMSATVYSQATRFSLSLQDVSIERLFQEIERQSDFTFLYKTDLIDTQRKVNLQVQDATIEHILDRILQGANVDYRVLENNLVILMESDAKSKQSIRQNIPIAGVITDENGEPLPGVNVTVKGTMTGVAMLHVSQYDVTF